VVHGICAYPTKSRISVVVSRDTVPQACPHLSMSPLTQKFLLPTLNIMNGELF
jgi:hypothetical protein